MTCLNRLAAYGISCGAYRKAHDWPKFKAESGFNLTTSGCDLRLVEPGIVTGLALRHWRRDSSVGFTFSTLVH